MTPSPNGSSGLRIEAQEGPPGDHDLVTAQECADWLRITRGHLYRLRDCGAIPSPIKIGRSLRWRRSDLTLWFRAGCPSEVPRSKKRRRSHE